MSTMKLWLAAAVAVLAGFAAVPAMAQDQKLIPAKVSWVGLTCEAPIYVAYEKGYFKDEGLDVELVKVDWNGLKEGLSFGRIDATHTLVMYVLKPMEQGMDARITAGIHQGCLRVQVAVDSPIKTLQDLKGKRIGVPLMGSPPFIFASRVLGSNGFDLKKDVEWKSFPAPELALAIQKNEVDAIATADPIGTLLVEQGLVRTVIDQATDAPYKDEYCCAVVVSGQVYKENPDKAARLTRAIVKGAKWVQANPMAAAKLSVDAKYLPTKVELNAKALSGLNYIPSIKGGQEAVQLAARDMQKAGMLNASTDVNALIGRAFGSLQGVDDKWIESVEVEKVANGDFVPHKTASELLEMVAQGGSASCCAIK